jgi:serine/threonine protein phosphatase PrpC
VSCPQGAEFGFAVVSDGMGGHAAGDLASRIIVAEVFAELTLRGRAALAAPEDLAELLKASVQTANASLQAQIEAFPEQSGMGGTVVATSLVDGGLQWVSVGDSLLYLLRDGMLKRLNDDHSMGPQIDLMAKNGMIDAEAARTHPQRNCLTSALTGKDIPELDCPPRKRLELEDGDIIVLASDGLQSLAEEDIASILDSLSEMESREIATALIRAVAAEGVSDQDNTSVAVIRVYQPEPEPEVAAGTDGRRPCANAGRSGPFWAASSAVRACPPPQRRSRKADHDGDGSRYPVHAQAARGASVSGVLTQAEAVSCSGLAEALRRPARVAILGQSARDVTGVLRAMLGEGLVSVLPDGPASS